MQLKRGVIALAIVFASSLLACRLAAQRIDGNGVRVDGATLVFSVFGTGTIGFSAGSGGVNDAAFSRLGPASIALGNGVAGNTTGTLTLASLFTSGNIVSSGTAIQNGANGVFSWNGRTQVSSASDGLMLVNNSGNTLGTLIAAGVAPTVTSGFGSGTAGTLVTGSTVFNFRITVGTNAGGTTGVIGLPTTVNYWNCALRDQTTVADLTNQTGSTANSATFTATVAWTTGDILIGGCTGS